MSQKTKQRTGEFEAEANDGTNYTVIEYTELIHSGGHIIPGLKELVTSDGRHVNYIDDTHYEIVGRPNIPLRKVT